jgi:predicted nucleic-acid-binding protein
MSGRVIGVDTNVLLRLFVTDNADQHRAAAAFFAQRTRQEPAFVNAVVMAEFAWVLRRSYGYSKSHVLGVVGYLVGAIDVQLQHGEAVAEALDLCTNTGEEFGDVFIAAINRNGAVQRTMTFDKTAARRVPGMELLA